MKTIYILHKGMGFFHSRKKPYYLVMRTDAIYAVDNNTKIERSLLNEISISSTKLRITEGIWIAFSSKAKMKAYIMQLELDKTLGEIK